LILDFFIQEIFFRFIHNQTNQKNRI
jgi:hypothetical protein